jgi:hypothetical protein
MEQIEYLLFWDCGILVLAADTVRLRRVTGPQYFSVQSLLWFSLMYARRRQQVRTHPEAKF